MSERDDFAEKWSEQFAINLNALEEEVIRQPASYSYYSTRAARAKTKERQARYELERVEAAQKAGLAQTTVTVGGKTKALTAQQIEARVKLTEPYQTALIAYIKAKEVSEILQSDVQASWQKYEALKLLSFNVQRELKQKDYVKGGTE